MVSRERLTLFTTLVHRHDDPPSHGQERNRGPVALERCALVERSV